MPVDIKLVLSDQEQLIYHSLNMVNLAGQIVTKIQSVRSNLPNLSSEGAFHDFIGKGDSNGGLSRYHLKAQEFETICEVLYRHSKNTYDTMIDMDKVLATSIANLVLNDPTAKAEDKEAIKRDPKGSIDQIKRNYQEYTKSLAGGAQQ